MSRPEYLTKKQEQFVREYLVDFNATQACIRAGYASRSAASIGSELMKNPRIAADIESGTRLRGAVARTHSCLTCTFHDASTGTCRVMAPVAIENGYASWPRVHDLDWCGQGDWSEITEVAPLAQKLRVIGGDDF